MKSLLVAITAGVCLFSNLGFADQCLVVNAAQAKRALHFLKPGMQIIRYCEACGAFMGRPERVESIKVVPFASKYTSGTSYTVQLNGASVDLAHLFKRRAKTSSEFINAARLARCQATNVSSTIVWEDPKLGLTVECLNALELARAKQTNIDDNEQVSQFSRSVVQYVRDQHNPKIASSQLTEGLKQVSSMSQSVERISPEAVQAARVACGLSELATATP